MSDDRRPCPVCNQLLLKPADCVWVLVEQRDEARALLARCADAFHLMVTTPNQPSCDTVVRLAADLAPFRQTG